MQWHEPRQQRPGEETVGGAVDMNGEAKKLGVVQLVFEVYTRVWGVPYNRPFVLVRRLKRAPRSGRDAFPVDACKKRVVGHHGGVLLDVEGTKDKLGVLWTWDTSERGGAFKVLPGSRVLHAERSNDATLQERHGGVQHGIRHVREPVHAGQQGAPAVHAVQMWSPGLKNCLGTLKTVHQTVHQLF